MNINIKSWDINLYMKSVLAHRDSFYKVYSVLLWKLRTFLTKRTHHHILESATGTLQSWMMKDAAEKETSTSKVSQRLTTLVDKF
jgi:hypothetical protein